MSDDFVCDDRFDEEGFLEYTDNMTDEEFKKYIEDNPNYKKNFIRK